MKLFFKTAAALLISLSLKAQVVSEDSIKNLNQQKENIELSKKVNERKIKLADLENDLEKQRAEVTKTASEAQKKANDNEEVAIRLRNDPQNKKLANQADKAARDAEKSAKSARKAADKQEEIQKDIESLRKDISEDETKLGQAPTTTGGSTTITTPQSAQASYPQTSGSAGNAGNTSNAYNAPAQPASSAQSNLQATQQPQAQPNVQMNTTTMPSASSQAADIANRVVEQTYKTYPQQQGQPAIIINNIIVPSDYDRPKGGNNQASDNRMSQEDTRDYDDYKAWQRERAGRRSGAVSPAYPAQGYSNAGAQPAEYPAQAHERLTFKERFGELPARNSGLWVLPMVGVHASNFNADFQDGKADGRTGWNAGLDFRFHMKRFFIQPGVHYFSSSLEVTSEDSISNAPLLDGPRIHSLKVPLLLGIYLTKANSGFFKVNVKGGAVGTYVLSVDNNNRAEFARENLEDFSYGLAGGLGFEFGLISLDISHEWGMSKLFKADNSKNNVLRATIGLKL